VSLNRVVRIGRAGLGLGGDVGAGRARVAPEARAGGGMAYQEAGAEPRAGLALRESRLRRTSRRLVGAERVDENGVHGRHIAGGESHLARSPGKWRGRGGGMCGGGVG
jgi:hypothetical protein